MNHKPDKRIRGQIKGSWDWISLQNTENGYMWAERNKKKVFKNVLGDIF